MNKFMEFKVGDKVIIKPIKTLLKEGYRFERPHANYSYYYKEKTNSVIETWYLNKVLTITKITNIKAHGNKSEVYLKKGGSWIDSIDLEYIDYNKYKYAKVLYS